MGRSSGCCPTPVNPSLILFVKMTACAVGISRDFATDVVISAGLLIECGVMRNIMIFAAVMIGLGTFMAQMADKMTATTPALANAAARKAAPAETVGQAGRASLN